MEKQKMFRLTVMSIAIENEDLTKVREISVKDVITDKATDRGMIPAHLKDTVAMYAKLNGKGPNPSGISYIFLCYIDSIREEEQ